MSDDLYPVRVRWYNGAGIAKRYGRQVALADAPDLGSGPVHELEYSPGIGVREMRPRPIDERRDLRIDEEAAVLALLREAVPTQPGAL